MPPLWTSAHNADAHKGLGKLRFPHSHSDCPHHRSTFFLHTLPTRHNYRARCTKPPLPNCSQARSPLASRFPHPCEASGSGELVRVHLLSGAITAAYRGIPQRTRGVRRRKVQPHVREHVVLKHGSSIAVGEPEAVVLRPRVFLDT